MGKIKLHVEMKDILRKTKNNPWRNSVALAGSVNEKRRNERKEGEEIQDVCVSQVYFKACKYHKIFEINDKGQIRLIVLHNEMKAILIKNNNQWITKKKIARKVNKRGRYLKKEGAETQDVKKFQIKRRVRKYLHIFEKDPSGRIRLKFPYEFLIGK